MFHLGAALLQNLAVSPELTLRPSLSDFLLTLVNPWRSRVSPELTLRPSLSEEDGRRALPLLWVSPELTLRPSLSGLRYKSFVALQTVSPELTLRPSLSALLERRQRVLASCVAGANAPAFVERSCLSPVRPS